MKKQNEFFVLWHDYEKCVAKAKALGWVEGEESLLDYYHPEQDMKAGDIAGPFTLEQAIERGRAIIASGVTMFGALHVREIETVTSRCRYCICHGRKTVREFIVEEEGVVQEEWFDDCLDDSDL